MDRKSYYEKFRRQAADLYETTPGATVRGIAQDLGIERGTLVSGWPGTGPNARPGLTAGRHPARYAHGSPTAPGRAGRRRRLPRR